jgi:hypothetical protein
MACAGRIEAVGGFVEHQQPGGRQQRGGKPETLSHPEREAANAVVGDIGEADPLEHVIDASRAVAPQASQRGEVLPRGQRGIGEQTVTERLDDLVVGDLNTVGVLGADLVLIRPRGGIGHSGAGEDHGRRADDATSAAGPAEDAETGPRDLSASSCDLRTRPFTGIPAIGPAEHRYSLCAKDSSSGET